MATFATLVSCRLARSRFEIHHSTLRDLRNPGLADWKARMFDQHLGQWQNLQNLVSAFFSGLLVCRAVLSDMIYQIPG